jgi:hypothetical protein
VGLDVTIGTFAIPMAINCGCNVVVDSILTKAPSKRFATTQCREC